MAKDLKTFKIIHFPSEENVYVDLLVKLSNTNKMSLNRIVIHEALSSTLPLSFYIPLSHYCRSTRGV